MKKRVFILVLICFFIVVSLVNIFLILLSPLYGIQKITGKGLIGTIQLIIEAPGGVVTINHPGNTTYNFSIGDSYNLSLNASASFSPTLWWFALYDLRHGALSVNNLTFTPNTTFTAVRWSNRLFVYAQDAGGNTITSEVIFFVSVPNSAPIIQTLDDNVYLCENNYLSYYFNTTDVDEDILSSDISPRNPFYARAILRYLNTTITEIYSGTLGKNKIGVYGENVSVSDGQYSDSKNINISVIEINNPPSIGAIGVHTIWTSGENSSFYKQVLVTDTEDGNQDSGNFSFNISFLNSGNLFNISNIGVMNFSANSSISTGVYNISICARDNGIASIHQNISLCGQTGQNSTICQNFSLTVTNENRAPNITSYYPLNLSLGADGRDTLYFNVSKYDADGTVPDTYWYVDNSQKQYNSGNTTDEFRYIFGCGVSGAHIVKAVVTDGLSNASVEWNVSVSLYACTVAGVGGGGIAGAAGLGCYENWGCVFWKECQNTKRSFEAGSISNEDYESILSSCKKFEYDDRYCGFQIRSCADLNGCNNTKYRREKPDERQICYYTELPSCSDGITNCHHNSCEILVDCGGPCSACPSCSDKIKNQGESGIDCGGPCPWQCPIEKPLIKKPELKYFVIILAALLLVLILLRVMRIIFISKKIKKEEKQKQDKGL